MISGLCIIDDILRGLPEKAKLREQLTELRLQVETMQSELEADRAEMERSKLLQMQPSSKLPDESEKMLVIIANSSGGRITLDMVIRRLGLPQARGDYLFDQLCKRKLVSSSSGQMGLDSSFHATSSGLEYLHQKGLL